MVVFNCGQVEQHLRVPAKFCGLRQSLCTNFTDVDNDRESGKTYQRCWQLRRHRWRRCLAVRSTCAALSSSLWNTLFCQKGSSVWGWWWLHLWKDLRTKQMHYYYSFICEYTLSLAAPKNENKTIKSNKDSLIATFLFKKQTNFKLNTICQWIGCVYNTRQCWVCTVFKVKLQNWRKVHVWCSTWKTDRRTVFWCHSSKRRLERLS